MSVLRNRPKGTPVVPFGLGLCIFAVIPNEIGHQDIGALLARQPGTAERVQKYVASSASKIQVATFSFPRPIGSSLPQTVTYRLASLDTSGSGVTGPLTRHPLGQSRRLQASDFPVVERALKGDRLPLFSPEAPATVEAPKPAEDPATSNASVRGMKTAGADAAAAPLHAELVEALKAPPLPQYDVSLSLEDQPGANQPEPSPEQPKRLRDSFTVQTAHLYFGHGSLGVTGEAMERWQPGEEPIVVLPPARDPDIKATASLPVKPNITIDKEGLSVASKGEIKAPVQLIKIPAERLNLSDPKARAKQEKCLANAVYFEARGEPVRGQIAVAQVVINRAFSGYYPETVCGVVYQNAHRRLACQFTFACDGIRDVVTEPEQWERAKRIAKETLDGRIWLPEVGKSTHYHAYYVRPYWARTMKKLNRTGAHLFYRPRQWGDGSDAPVWGTAAQTAAITKQLTEAKSADK
ncbi:MAG: cell wall hydrolase [Pseudomonadota bacterium]